MSRQNTKQAESLRPVVAPKVSEAETRAELEETTQPISGLDGRTSKQEQISALAYEIWLSRGGSEGTDEEDWLEAERRLRGQGDGSRGDGMGSPNV